MSALDAYAGLTSLKRPVVTTAEAVAKLGISRPYATHLLRRMAKLGLIVRLRRGTWLLSPSANPYTLVEYLTAPYPAYVSVWTALYEHGMIDQVPRMIYVVSLDRAKRIRTPLGTFQIQHISPVLFGGFQRREGASLATAEKALFDTTYLLAIRSGRKVRLPELEIPEGFSEEEVYGWVERIPSVRKRSLVSAHVHRILTAACGRTS